MIHNSCNMAIHDLPDMYVLSPRALGIHIRQIPHGHVTTITCSLLRQKYFTTDYFLMNISNH